MNIHFSKAVDRSAKDPGEPLVVASDEKELVVFNHMGEVVV